MESEILLVENYEAVELFLWSCNIDLFLYTLFPFLVFNMVIPVCEFSGVVLLISW